MKKLIILLMAVLTLLVIVSCSQESAVEERCTLVSFSAEEKATRGLSRTMPEFVADDLYWMYEAAKTDSTTLTQGQTNGQTAVKDGKGLGVISSSAFSYGKWKFTLYGYTDEGHTKLAYKGEAAEIVNSSSKTVTVGVETLTSASGILHIPGKSEIRLMNSEDGEVSDYSKFVEKVSYKKVGDTNTAGTRYIEDTAVDISLTSGTYEVTVSFQNRKDEDDTPATLIVYASETVFVTVADYLTTTVSGDIFRNGSEVNFSPSSKWIVSFNSNGGSAVETQFVENGKYATEPTAPTYEGYSIVGWTKEDGTDFNFKTMTVTSDITLVAKWQKSSYTVTFNLNGGNGMISSQTLNPGETATRPTTNPTKDNYSFWGWYADGSDTAYDFTSEVSGDITLTAKWKAYSDIYVGSTGPAGGYVFYDAGKVMTSSYVDSSGNTVEYKWRFLEAAASDIENTMLNFCYYRPNGSNTTVLKDETNDSSGSSAIGQGRYNTTKLVKEMGAVAYCFLDSQYTDTIEDYVAKLCDEYTCNGYDDWFLPSIQELNLMYTNLKAKSIGNFKSTPSFSTYFSSTEYSGLCVWGLDFSSGSSSSSRPRNGYDLARAVRAFL